MQILTLGMHRSGTSAVTRMIHLMGAWIGTAEDCMPAHPQDNPEGYWERRAIISAHNQILHRLTPTAPSNEVWLRIANFTPESLSILSAENLNPLREELALLDTHSPWVLKDPRLCLLLPLWQQLLNRPVYVLINRHPLEIALSLNRRVNQPLPIEFGLSLWEKYTLCLLQALHGKTVLVVSHARLLAEPWQQSQRLYAFFRTQGSGLNLPKREDVEHFINPRLHRSHHETQQDTLWLTAQQMAIHNELELYAQASNSIIVDTAAKEMPNVRLAEYEQLFNGPSSSRLQPDNLQLQADILHAKQHIEALTNEQRSAHQELLQIKTITEECRFDLQNRLAAETAENRRLENRLVAETAENQRLENTLTNVMREREMFQGQAENYRHQAGSYEQHANALRDSLTAIKNSWSWRLTSPLRLFK